MNLLDAHTQWANRPADQRFQNLTDLRNAVNTRRMRSRSVDIQTNRIEASAPDGNLIINGTIQPCEPSHWAFGQLATTIGAPASYLRKLPLPLVLPLLNHGMKDNATRDAVKFMTVEGDNGNTLQAVTSPTYGRIWDADVVDSVDRLVERTGGKFYNPRAYAGGQFGAAETEGSGLYASDHDVFIFMIDGGSLLDAGPRAQLNRGFIVWNSETGARTFGLMTFLFNQVCGNHIIWGAQEVNKMVIRHTSGGPARFDREAAPALRAYAEASAQPMIDTVQKAQQFLLPSKQVNGGKETDMDALLAFCGKHGKFTRSEVTSARDFAKSEEGDCRTLWHLVQGFTAYARGFDFIDARLDLEKRAGSLLKVVSASTEASN